MDFNPSGDQENQRRLNKQESENQRTLPQSEGYPRNHGNNEIPPGWLDCASFGQDILGCIIPSKAPLDESFQTNIPPAKTYSFDQVNRSLENLDAKLSLVIDLTNTCRYYSASDLKRKGIDYVKIRCKGRDAVPDNFSVNIFVYELLKFVSRGMESKNYVLVHCTHGHNRTGFMIVHYLMRSQPLMSVSRAMEIFAQARPPGIYKQDYIDALYAFYNEMKPATFAYPSPPWWKTSTNAVMNKNHTPEADPATKNDDNSGDRIPFNQVKLLRESCYKLLNLNDERAKRFPGSHPVSLNRENLQLLRQHYYYATWKADGTRYMMLITLDGCYLIDRNFSFRRVQIRFPCSCRKRTHHYTLLDGEMVIDTLPVSQNKERRFLVFDIIACNGNTLMEKPFFERWNTVEKEVIEPRNRDQTSENSCYRYGMESFRVQRKDFWCLSTVPRILNEFIPKLCHEADGLIFQGRDDPYTPYTHEGLLKWKSAEMNSVDFLFETGVNYDKKLFLHEHGRKKLMDGQRVEFRDGLDPDSYSGMIIECFWDSKKQMWVYMRKRSDKSSPNDFNTYMKVMRSINDNITADILLKEIDEMVTLPMYKHPRTKQLSFNCLHMLMSVFIILIICYMQKGQAH
ncbi:hypothetical protein V6N13_095284 [Hibiscus sabdariffa]|uniref:mRNA guanylyltransferase n=1 Tax=Hibiscus sabdariffa TaxID=183260 RepID=A0ABR2PS32_9ROSI